MYAFTLSHSLSAQCQRERERSCRDGVCSGGDDTRILSSMLRLMDPNFLGKQQEASAIASSAESKTNYTRGMQPLSCAGVRPFANSLISISSLQSVSCMLFHSPSQLNGREFVCFGAHIGPVARPPVHPLPPARPPTHPPTPALPPPKQPVMELRRASGSGAGRF